jgi:hypothetical protein
LASSAAVSLAVSSVSLPSTLSWLTLAPVFAAPVLTPMSASEVRPVRPPIAAPTVDRSEVSMPDRPVSPKSVPFWRSVSVEALGTVFSVRSARVVVTSAL